MKVGRKSDRVTASVLVFEEAVMREIRWLQLGRPVCMKNQFCCEMRCVWDSQNPGEMVLGLVTLTDMLGNGLMVLRV